MLTSCSLDQSEHKVALLERSRPDLPVVVSAQTLLVDGRPAECEQPAFLQQVDAVFSRLLGIRLGVHGDPWGVEFDIRRDDGFGTVDEEERCEACLFVWSCAQAPEDGRQLVEPAAGRTLQRLDQSGLDAEQNEAVCPLHLAV